MGDTEPEVCLVRLSDDALSQLTQLSEEDQTAAIEDIGRILSDVLSYTEAVRLNNLAFLLNDMPSIGVLGDQLMGRKSSVFEVRFKSFTFYMVCVKGSVVIIHFSKIETQEGFTVFHQTFQ